MGKKRIVWADGDMPVLARIRERESMGIKIDELTSGQQTYMSSWEQGT